MSNFFKLGGFLSNTISFSREMERLPGMASAMNNLLDNMYVAGVINRLRAIETPQQNERERWIYELLQNAKDSISGDPQRDNVDIEVTVTRQDLHFKHNGSPFTSQALLGLLYKYSEGKQTAESTGRFGTGFLTTHCLSKEVTVRGDTWEDEACTQQIGFQVTIYRSGETDVQLREGLELMRKSWTEFRPAPNSTTFTYHLKTDLNRKSLAEGLSNFKANGPLTMLFCPEIRSIRLTEGDTVTNMSRRRSNLEGNLKMTRIRVAVKDKHKDHYFVHTGIEQPSPELTKKYRQDRTLRLTVAVEVDPDNPSLIEQAPNVPSHFCVFPLVGSEAHVMPLVINSPDFEPNAEREYLILDGGDENSVTGTISDTGINRMILKATIPLFDSLVAYFAREHDNLHLLLRGMKSPPTTLRLFDQTWFTEMILTEYRKVLSNYPIVDTTDASGSTQRRKLFGAPDEKNVCFASSGAKDNEREFYRLVVEYVGADRIPLRKSNSKWAAYVWSDCEIITVDSLCKTIADHTCLEDLGQSAVPGFDCTGWLDRLFGYLCKSRRLMKLFTRYAIIPNATGTFLFRESPDLARARGLKQAHLHCVAELGQDMSDTLVHPDISNLEEIVQNVVNVSVLSRIISIQVENLLKTLPNGTVSGRISDSELSNGVRALWPILRLIPAGKNLSDSMIGLASTQKQLCQCLAPFSPREPKPAEITGFTEVAWDLPRKWCISQLIQYVAGCQEVSRLALEGDSEKIAWINELGAFLHAVQTEIDFAKAAVIPNRKGRFCRGGDLFISKIPEIFLTPAFVQFGKDFASDLVHPGIALTWLQISRAKTMLDVGSWVKDALSPSSRDLLPISKQKLAFFVTHSLPPAPEKGNTESDENSINQTILRLIRALFPRDVDGLNATTLEESLPDFWNRSILRFSLELVLAEVSKPTTIKELGRQLNGVDPGRVLSDIFRALGFAVFRGVSAPAIFPNELGEFCPADRLWTGGQIPTDLKEIQLQLTRGQEDVRRDIISPDFVIPDRFPIRELDLKQFCKKIDDRLQRVFNGEERSDLALRKPVAELCRKWADPKNARQLFPSLMKSGVVPPSLFPYLTKHRHSIFFVMVLAEDKREFLFTLAEQSVETLRQIVSNLPPIAEERTGNDPPEEAISEPCSAHESDGQEEKEYNCAQSDGEAVECDYDE
jgi:hypothetical protein